MMLLTLVKRPRTERKRQLINNGNPAEIDAILNYLINELNIDKQNTDLN